MGCFFALGSFWLLASRGIADRWLSNCSWQLLPMSSKRKNLTIVDYIALKCVQTVIWLPTFCAYPQLCEWLCSVRLYKCFALWWCAILLVYVISVSGKSASAQSADTACSQQTCNGKTANCHWTCSDWKKRYDFYTSAICRVDIMFCACSCVFIRTVICRESSAHLCLCKQGFWVLQPTEIPQSWVLFCPEVNVGLWILVHSSFVVVLYNLNICSEI